MKTQRYIKHLDLNLVLQFFSINWCKNIVILNLATTKISKAKYIKDERCSTQTGKVWALLPVSNDSRQCVIL